MQSPLYITDYDCNVLLKNKQAGSLIKSIGQKEMRALMIGFTSKLPIGTPTFQEHVPVPSDTETLQLDIRVSRMEGEELLMWSGSDQSAEYRAKEEAKYEKDRAAHAEKMASIGEMAASIVHEIRNPLTIISGQVTLAEEFLARGKMTDEFVEKLITRLNKSTGRINAIIKSLLNISRNTGSEEKQLCSLSEIYEEVELFASMKIKGTTIPLTFDEYNKEQKVYCLPSELSQVLINLVKNAKEEIYQTPKPWFKITTQCLDDCLEIRVVDCGNGIPQSVLDKIFQPYFTTKARGEGTGLGLSLCKKLIEENHQGQFFVDASAPNTTFVISLPHK